MKNMNILDAYIKYNKQLIIFISGLSGSNKSKIAQNLANEFKINFINTRDYLNKNIYDEKELPNGKKIRIYNEFKWSEILDKINELKGQGIIVSGEYFPIDKLNEIYVDLHLHIKLTKQNIIKKRLNYIKMLNDNEKKSYNDDDTETLIVNQILYPYYLDILQKSHINKFINANEYIELNEDEYNEKVTDKIFNIVIENIIENLKSKKLDKYIVY